MSDATSPDSPPPKSRSRALIMLPIVAVGVVLGLWYGVPAWRFAQSHESTDNAYLEASMVAVSARVPGRVADVAVVDNQWVAAGELLVELDAAPYQAAVDVASAELEAARGDATAFWRQSELTRAATTAAITVAESAVADAEADLAISKADLAQAESTLAHSRFQAAVATANIAPTQSAVAAATAIRDRDVADLARVRELAATDAATPQQVDHADAVSRSSAAAWDGAKELVAVATAEQSAAEARIKIAADAVEVQKAEVAASQAGIVAAKARLSAAQVAPVEVAWRDSLATASEARVARAEAALAQARLSLADTRIVAARDGYVTRKSVSVGNYVQPGQSLITLVTRSLWVTANFKETQLTEIRASQAVVIHVDAYPDHSFPGHVQSIQRGTGSRFSLLPPENASGNFIKVTQRVPVKIVFDDPDVFEHYVLVPGMSAVPEIDLRSSGDTPAAPAPGTAPSPASSSAK